MRKFTNETCSVIRVTEMRINVVNYRDLVILSILYMYI